MTHGLHNDGGPGRNRSHRKTIPGQGDLFESTSDVGREEGRRRRDRGTKIAEHGATAIARRAGEDGIRRLARDRDTFSADDLHDLLEAERGPTIPSKLVGALFLNAQRRGEITAVGWTISERASRHGGPQRVWRGVAR